MARDSTAPAVGRGGIRGSGVGWACGCAVFLFWLAGCGTQSERPVPPRHERDARALEALLQADRDFAAAVARNGLEAWVATFGQDGLMLPPGGPVVAGQEAVKAFMAPAFSDPGFVLTWEPAGGSVAAAGDMGYTFGIYESRRTGAAPERGRYLTVWRLDGDGKWRVAADIGNREPQVRGKGDPRDLR
jgi:ketosteroid isomerase-like protein